MVCTAITFFNIQTVAFASTGQPNRLADKSADKYVAVKFHGKILVSNSKWSYVVDPSDLTKIVQKEGYAIVKVYSTGIYIQINKTGDLLIRHSRVTGVPFYVLAPMKSLEAPTDSNNYKIAVYVPGGSNSMIYPAEFCTDCAVPTHIDKAMQKITDSLVVLAAEGKEADHFTAQ